MKQNKQFNCGYLYADGHAVIVWEKQDADAGAIQFCEVYERWTEAQLSFKGRIVMGNVALMRLAKEAKQIQASEPSVKHGSDRTKEINQPVGSLVFRMSNDYYRDSLYFYDLPGLLSGQHTYQPDVVEEWATIQTEYTWASHRIAKFHRLPVKATSEAVAA